MARRDQAIPFKKTDVSLITSLSFASPRRSPWPTFTNEATGLGGAIESEIKAG